MPPRDDKQAHRVGERPSVTVITATYNRSAYLPRLYDSLVEQTFQDFEWIVVDDGSTDATEEQILTWQEGSRFPIRYFWQKNSGRLVALNRGVQEAHGEYCAVIDSDDWYPLRALERMVLRWREIPLVERERFANVEGLCTSKNGTSLSSQSRLPQPILDADNFSIIARYHVFDDKMGMYRTKVLREFPFPAHANKFIPEDTVFFQIAERYRSRFVDEVWGFKEYLPSGLSKEIRDKGSEFAYGFRLFNKTVISLQLEKPTRMLFKAYVNFVRYSLHEGIWLGTQRSEVPSTPGWLLAVPFGAALYLRDRWRTSRQSDRSS